MRARWLVLGGIAALVAGCILDRDGRLQATSGSGGGGGTGPGPGGQGGAGAGAQGGTGGVLDPPPNPVEDLAASVQDGVLTVTWTNPSEADLAGILVVHRPVNQVSFSPVDGTTYSAGDEVMTGQDAIFSELGETATYDEAVPGLAHHVAVWAVDEAGQYSADRRAIGLNNALGTQTAQIEITVPGGLVTVNQQPAHFPLTGTANYNAAMDELDVTLTARNDTARPVYNLKALLESQNQGTFVTAGSMPTGEPFAYYGPKGLDVAATAPGAFVIDDVDGSVSPITFEVSLVDAPWLIGQRRELGTFSVDRSLLLVDASGSGAQVELEGDAGPSFAFNFKGMAVSTDGRRAFVGAKSSPFVTAIDLVAAQDVLGADLANGRVGMVSGVAVSPDGEHLYAALTEGAHHKTSVGDASGTMATSTTLALVEVDQTTLVEIQRVALLTDDANTRMTRAVAVSNDGTTAAVAVRTPWGDGTQFEIHFVDLATFTVIDTDTGTAEVDPVTIADDNQPDQLLFNADDTRLFVTTRFPSEVVVVDLSNYSTATLSPSNPMERTNSLFLLDDALLVGADDIVGTTGGDGLTRFSLADDSQTVIDPGFSEVRKIVGDDERYYVYGNTQIAVFDRATDTRIDIDGDGGNGTTNIPLRNGMMWCNHIGVMTPF